MSYKQQYKDCELCPVLKICESRYANIEVICANEDNLSPEELQAEFEAYLDALHDGDWKG